MSDSEAIPQQRGANGGGGLLVMVHGILTEVGAVYLLTASIMATGIAAFAVVVVTCMFLYVHRRPA
jgi:hypothetical protein